MKLNDIENTSSQELNAKMQAKLGWNIQLEKLTVSEAQGMISSIDNKLSSVRASKRLHESQNDANYTGMLLARKVLESFITEAKISEKAVSKAQQQAAAIAMHAPKSKLKGASAEMAKMPKKELEKFAKTKHKGLPKHVGESILAEDEVTQAQSVMAAKDMVDSIQGMLEDVSKMMNEQLPPLTDSIRGSIGSAQADAFQSSTSATLNTLLSAVQQARTSMDSAVRSMTGEPAPVAVPGADDAGELDLGAEGDDLEADDFGASDAAAGGELPLGREKRK